MAGGGTGGRVGVAVGMIGFGVKVAVGGGGGTCVFVAVGGGVFVGGVLPPGRR